MTFPYRYEKFNKFLGIAFFGMQNFSFTDR